MESEHAKRVRVLREMSEDIRHIHSSLAGVVHLSGAVSKEEDVSGILPDGVHRLEGEHWQFTVENGCVTRAVRLDMKHYLAPEETVHPLEHGDAAPGEQDGADEESAPTPAKGKRGKK